MEIINTKDSTYAVIDSEVFRKLTTEQWRDVEHAVKTWINSGTSGKFGFVSDADILKWNVEAVERYIKNNVPYIKARSFGWGAVFGLGLTVCYLILYDLSTEEKKQEEKAND